MHHVRVPEAAAPDGDTCGERRAQRALKVQEKHIDVAVKEERLFEREMTLRRAYAFFRGVRDAILNFLVRYAAAMAADLGVDPGKLQFVLDRRLKELLTAIADQQLKI